MYEVLEGSSVVEQRPVKTPVEGSIPSPPAISEFMLGDDKPYFPGLDYPDRDEWLKRRYTHPSKRGVPCALIARGQLNNRRMRRAGRFQPDLPKAKPLYAGINRAKRALDTTEYGRTDIVRQRHEFYQSRSAEHDKGQ